MNLFWKYYGHEVHKLNNWLPRNFDRFGDVLRYGLVLFDDIFKCWSMLSNDLERFVVVPGRENNVFYMRSSN